MAFVHHFARLFTRRGEACYDRGDYVWAFRWLWLGNRLRMLELAWIRLQIWFYGG